MFWSGIVDYLGWGSWGRERIEIPFKIEGRERGELLVSGGGREGLSGDVGEGHERGRGGKERICTRASWTSLDEGECRKSPCATRARARS